VGCLLNATTITGPDAAHAANKLSEFLQNLGPVYLGVANQAIAYLFLTCFCSLQFSINHAEMLLFCASDAAYADDPLTHWSMASFVFQLIYRPIDWMSTKQRTVMILSTEAELLTPTDAAKVMYS
jgi:hypothetical protein